MTQTESYPIGRLQHCRIGLVRELQVLMYGEWIACKEQVDPRIWSEIGGE